MNDVWEQFINLLPEKLVLLCTALSFLIPYTVYQINRKLHEHGDPPWKKEANGGGDNNKGNKKET